MLITPTLRQIQAFLMVSRLGSFTRAAEELCLSQSALSQAINQLEHLLDARLLDRSKRRVTLTPAGRRFLSRAERAITELGMAINEVKEAAAADTGNITIACLSTVATGLLPGAVRAYKSRYPKVSVVIRDDDIEGIVRRVKDGEVDFAITCLFSDDRDIDFEPLIEDHFRFVCHRSHSLSGRERVRWDELSREDLVAMVRGSGVRTLIERKLPDDRVFRDALYEVSRIPSVLSIVENGDCVSVVPALSLARPGLEQTLYHCPIVEPDVRRSVGILTRKDQALSAIAAVFREILIEQLDISMLDSYPDIRLLRKPRERARA